MQTSTTKQSVAPEYVRVTCVEKSGHEDVYDLSVIRHHNFSVSGGLIVHNCMDALRYLVFTKTNRSRLDRIAQRLTE